MPAPTADTLDDYRRVRGTDGVADVPIPDLVRLISSDLDNRWSRGMPKRVEEYVCEFPELNPVPAELILAEYHARQRHATTASTDEYFVRFPGHADTLAALLSGTLAAPAAFAPAVVPVCFDAGQRLDDFDLLALVGEGSFAKVFLARQRSLQRLVALKVSADSGTEPQTLAQLDHPHVVRVYDQRSLPERGLRLLYMPYLPGGTLRDVLQVVRQTPPAERSGKLLLQSVDEALSLRGEVPPTDSNNRQRVAGMTWGETVCWLGARLADALDYAHGRGVLHRDVKPANVLLGADAAPRLADFNVSASTGAGAAATFGGSIAYMSPEQLEAFDPQHPSAANDLDGRSDAYSLAVMLWELLTGTRPFPVESNDVPSLASLATHRRRPISPEVLATLPNDLPPGLVDVLTTCLKSNPAERYASAGELARQLDLCLKPRTRELLVLKPGWRTWVSRHPLIALYAVGLVPNIIAAAFNIEYNRTTLVEKYEEAQGTFKLLQIVVNGTFFPVCMGIFGWYIWPVARGIPLARKGLLSEIQLATLRRRALKLGTVSVLVCLTAWVAAGAIFPVALSWTIEDLPLAFHLHFLASQTLSGLMAVAYPQFGVTFLALRCLYPAFVEKAALTRDDAVGLRAVDRSQTWYLFVAACVPMLAVGLLSGFASENRTVLVLLSLNGLIGFAISILLTNAIRADRAALEAVVKE